MAGKHIVMSLWSSGCGLQFVFEVSGAMLWSTRLPRANATLFVPILGLRMRVWDGEFEPQLVSAWEDPPSGQGLPGVCAGLLGPVRTCFDALDGHSRAWKHCHGASVWQEGHMPKTLKTQ